MASVKLSQLYGGGEFKAEFFSGALSHSLSSTTPLVISPAETKTLRLDALNGNIGDVTVQIGGATVISSKTLLTSSSNSVGGFVVATTGGATTGSASVSPLIAFDSDQTITISTTTGAAGTINYSYSYGE